MSVVLLRPADAVLFLTAYFDNRTVQETFPTEREAWEAADRHYVAGAHQVRISGLSVWGAVGCDGCGDGIRLS
jgi:hypothetical protein